MRPLGAKRREVNTLSRKQCIDRGNSVLDGSGFPEDLGAITKRRKLAITIGIRIKVLPEAAAEAARSSQILATAW